MSFQPAPATAAPLSVPQRATPSYPPAPTSAPPAPTAATNTAAVQRGPSPTASAALQQPPPPPPLPPTKQFPGAPLPSQPSTAATTSSTAAANFASSKNTATQRKVAKLLDITTSTEIKDLASYVDEILPGYFYNIDADGAKLKGDSETASTSSNAGSPNTAAAAATASMASGKAVISSASLRSALDHRAIDMHKNFLHEFTAVYDNFQRVAAKVNELQEKCTSLEDVLATTSSEVITTTTRTTSSTGSSGGGATASTTTPAGNTAASAADDFFYQIQMHQAELQLVQHHEKEVDEFRKQHHFGPAEQQVLDEGPVDMNFLTVLERAREVHRRSSELMQSQEYHQGAAAVMESTYAAISRATEKIARHLLATAGTASSAVAAAAGRGEVNAVATTGGVGSIAADVPEVTGFQLRCVRLLYEESPSLHEKFLDEVARLRRASVLRRYFHLLTTGSATTASGLYQSGGQPRTEEAAAAALAGPGMGARPLEAELNNPTYFFSSLCAWLHQTIVEEQDFLHTFFMSDEADTGAARRAPDAASATAGTQAAGAVVEADRAKQDAARQRALLDSVFGGVCKHIRAALDNVLERLGRTASALGAAKNIEETSGAADGSAAATEKAASTAAPYKGPRGLTGGLTRLFMAATGRAPAAAFRRNGSEEGNAMLARYATVTTRAQLEAVAASTLSAPLQGVQTCVTLVQLFEYYTATTFAPLLGTESALTRLISETAPQQTREVFQRLLRVLSGHLLDSTAGIIQRTASLRRLAASNALSSTAAGTEGRATDAAASPPATTSISSNNNKTNSGSDSALRSTYVLDFLTSLTYGEEMEGVANASMGTSLGESKSDLAASTSNAKFRQANDGQVQRHSAQDLQRVLSQLILPPSPEVAAYCDMLDTVLNDTARQADLLQAISQQQQQQQQQQLSMAGTTSAFEASADSAFHLRTEVKAFVCELLQSLWRSAQSVQEDATLRHHLDDLCRNILQYNVMFQLQEIMERHCDVLDLLCDATPLHEAAANGSDGDGSSSMRQTLDTLRGESGAAMNALRRRLLSQWEAAVVRFYFPLSTESVVAAAALTVNAAGASSGAAPETEEQRQMAAKKDTRRVLKQVVNVYNTVASMGHLPEPVPLLPALCGSEAMRREVSAEVTRCVVERVYPAEFAALQRLPPSEELAAVQAEMSPQNLSVLVDFSSLAATPM